MAKTTNDIIVDPEFAALMPLHDEAEYNRLEETLLRDGCIDTLKVWHEKGILLDGHTRKSICDKHKIGYKIERMEFPSREAAMLWMIDFQHGRRNLTAEQKSYLRGKEYNLRKQSPGRQASVSAPQEESCDSSESTGEPDKVAASEMAEKHGVTERTLHRDGLFAAAVDELPKKQAKAVLAGDSPLTRADLMKRLRKARGLPPKPKKRQAKDKSPVFNWSKLEAAHAAIAEAHEEIAKFFDCQNCNEHRSGRARLAEYMELVGDWRKRLEEKAKKNTPDKE